YICRMGLVRTFQGVRLFPSMSALENVQTGHFGHARGEALSTWARLPWRESAFDRRSRERARELLDLVGLKGRYHVRASDLALATGPKLLLLDEPVAGMNPVEVNEAAALIRRIRDSGITVLLTEHHMSLVMKISDVITVLNYGRKIAEGEPRVVRGDPQVLEAYLGRTEVN